LAGELTGRGHDCLMLGSDGLGPLARRHSIAFECLGLRARSAQGRDHPHLMGHGGRHLRLHAPWARADRAARARSGGASLAAAAAGSPRITLAALPMHRDTAIPPPFVNWPFQAEPAGVKRNRGGWLDVSAIARAGPGLP